MLDEVSLIVFEPIPIFSVCAKINLVYCPEASHLVLVHFPDIGVLDRKNNKSVGVVFEERFGKHHLGGADLTHHVLGCGGFVVLLRVDLRVCPAINFVVFVEYL